MRKGPPCYCRRMKWPQAPRFLEAAVKTIIRRAAEVAEDPGGTFPTITLADLPGRL